MTDSLWQWIKNIPQGVKKSLISWGFAWWKVWLVLWIVFPTAAAFYYFIFCVELKEETARTLEESLSIAATLSAFFFATAALYLTARRTAEMNRQNNLVEQRNAADTFSRAVDQLGHDRSAVRRGGIATLSQLGESAEKENDLRQMVIKTLIAFVSDRVLMTERDEKTGERVGRVEKREDKLDVEDAIKALGSIAKGYAERTAVNLSRTDLRNLNFDEGSDLSFFDFTEADLRKASFRETDLRGANFFCSDLREAVLYRVDLRGADFYCTNLRGAKLRGANLRWISSMHADLKETWLREADLRGADLFHADLKSADLDRAKLKDANLSGANLIDTINLTENQLKGIRFYERFPPNLPKNLDLQEGDDSIIKPGDNNYSEGELEDLELHLPTSAG